MKKFRDLSKEEQLKLVEALLDGYTIIHHDGIGNAFKLTYCTGGGVHFYSSNYYEIEITKPSINWDSINPKWNYLAIDEDGDVYLFTDKPEVNSYEWRSEGVGDTYDITNSDIIVYNEGNCPWKDSLISRFDDQPVEATVRNTNE